MSALEEMQEGIGFWRVHAHHMRGATRSRRAAHQDGMKRGGGAHRGSSSPITSAHDAMAE